MQEDGMQKLRNAIERKVGYGLNTPNDFKQASKENSAHSGRFISTTTLMRIWGYVRDGGENYRPSPYSLSTLAIFLGYLDFKGFVERYTEPSGKQVSKRKSSRE